MAAIALPENLDLKAAAPLKAALLARRGAPIEIEADQVRRFGGLCLQVLLAARKAWDRDGQPFSIKGAFRGLRRNHPSVRRRKGAPVGGIPRS